MNRVTSGARAVGVSFLLVAGTAAYGAWVGGCNSSSGGGGGPACPDQVPPGGYAPCPSNASGQQCGYTNGKLVTSMAEVECTCGASGYWACSGCNISGQCPGSNCSQPSDCPGGYCQCGTEKNPAGYDGLPRGNRAVHWDAAAVRFHGQPPSHPLRPKWGLPWEWRL